MKGAAVFAARLIRWSMACDIVFLLEKKSASTLGFFAGRVLLVGAFAEFFFFFLREAFAE